MSLRTDKVNSLIKRELGRYLLHERYEEIKGLLTITAADVTPDMASAKVYFSVVGQDEEEVLKVLEKNIYEIQGNLNQKLVLRKVPRIKFIIDDSGKYAGHISNLIRGINED
jgi:ribosome-binding factor A